MMHLNLIPKALPRARLTWAFSPFRKKNLKVFIKGKLENNYSYALCQVEQVFQPVKQTFVYTFRYKKEKIKVQRFFLSRPEESLKKPT
jgi:hypothetical protein